MMRFSVDTSQVLPEFVVAHLQAPSTRLQILRRAKRAINQASINQQDVRKLTIVRPPISDQERFVAAISEARVVLRQGLEAQGNLRALFASLLHRAFSGELTASWRKAHSIELLQEADRQTRSLADASVE